MKPTRKRRRRRSELCINSCSVTEMKARVLLLTGVLLRERSLRAFGKTHHKTDVTGVCAIGSGTLLCIRACPCGAEVATLGRGHWKAEAYAWVHL